MTNPLSYDCPIEDLVGRKVVNAAGLIGHITSCAGPDPYPIVVKYRTNHSISTYTKEGYQFTSSNSKNTRIYFLDNPTPIETKTPPTEYSETIILIKKHTNCSTDQAIRLYEELNAHKGN